MSKLVFKTKKPRKGYVNHESFMTHETINFMDSLPPERVQQEAHEIVSDAMWELIKDLKAIGYDETKVAFSIHYSDL